MDALDLQLDITELGFQRGSFGIAVVVVHDRPLPGARIH
jgi:hypothetical protein